MTSAPATGCCSATLASKASAGGQLEQPSDVNNSKTTGTRSEVRFESAGVVCIELAWLIPARTTAKARIRDGRDKFSLIVTPLLTSLLTLRTTCSGLRRTTSPERMLRFRSRRND